MDGNPWFATRAFSKLGSLMKKEDQATLERRQMAAIARSALEEARRAMIRAHEEGGASGLCAEGRWELALDSLHGIDIEALVERVLASRPQAGADEL